MCYSALVEQDIKNLSKSFDRDLAPFGFNEFDDWHKQNPKKYKDIASNNRIFPFYFAAIVASGKQGLVCAPMRYQMWPASYEEDPTNLSLFNARMDNLDSPIWRNCFMKKHGIIVIQSFYEWVEVRDLLSAGSVSLDEVKTEFERQSELRKQRILSLGKRYSPTKTEKLEPVERKTIISFSASGGSCLFVPVLFDYKLTPEGKKIGSFAIVTTEPTPEILAAGHDRRPVFFHSREQAMKFLDYENASKAEIMSLMAEPPEFVFTHKLDRTA